MDCDLAYATRPHIASITIRYTNTLTHTRARTRSRSKCDVQRIKTQVALRRRRHCAALTLAMLCAVYVVAVQHSASLCVCVRAPGLSDIGISFSPAVCRIRLNGKLPILPLTFGQHQFESAIHIVRIALVFSCVFDSKKTKPFSVSRAKTNLRHSFYSFYSVSEISAFLSEWKKRTIVTVFHVKNDSRKLQDTTHK